MEMSLRNQGKSTPTRNVVPFSLLRAGAPRTATSQRPGVCAARARGSAGSASAPSASPSGAPRSRASKQRVTFFGWVFFLISLGSPHARPMGHTCGEPNKIELTAAHTLHYRSFSGHAAMTSWAPEGWAVQLGAAWPFCTYGGTLTKKSGKMFRVGIFLDFVWLTTRTPHGAYVRRARRNRIDSHGGEIERLALQGAAGPTSTSRSSRASTAASSSR